MCVDRFAVHRKLSCELQKVEWSNKCREEVLRTNLRVAGPQAECELPMSRLTVVKKTEGRCFVDDIHNEAGQ